MQGILLAMSNMLNDRQPQETKSKLFNVLPMTIKMEKSDGLFCTTIFHLIFELINFFATSCNVMTFCEFCFPCVVK